MLIAIIDNVTYSKLSNTRLFRVLFFCKKMSYRLNNKKSLDYIAISEFAQNEGYYPLNEVYKKLR
ncbi:MAG: hypothetical protein LIO59_04725, partial [Oscillospiraceae bacterium]|nr:hypothetical protein [Oscillospiraceae bacterium]